MTWTSLAIEVLSPVLMALGGLLVAYATAWVRSLKLSADHERAALGAVDAADAAVRAEYAMVLEDVRAAAADGVVTADEWGAIWERARRRLERLRAEAPARLAPVLTDTSHEMTEALIGRELARLRAEVGA